MIRFPLSVLIASATALLLFTMDRQADAYDHFAYRPAFPPCHAGDYSYGFHGRLPDGRYDCGYDRYYSYRPSRTRCQGRDCFVPAYPRNAPAPRSGVDFQQPNFPSTNFQQQNQQQAHPRVNPPGWKASPERQFDPFEKYAPSRLNSQKRKQGKPAPDYPIMELPPPVPGSSNQSDEPNRNGESSPESRGHQHGHDHKHEHSGSREKTGSAGPPPEADDYSEDGNPSLQPELPRISPPSAKFLIPQGS